MSWVLFSNLIFLKNNLWYYSYSSSLTFKCIHTSDQPSKWNKNQEGKVETKRKIIINITNDFIEKMNFSCSYMIII